MGSIPLPALDVRPPAQQQGPLSMMAQALGIKNQQQELAQRQAMAPLQQQEAQQAVQGGQLDVEAKQRAADDQKAMLATMQQWGKGAGAPVAGGQGTVDGGQQPAAGAAPAAKAPMPGYDDLVPLAIKNGASFQAVQGLQQHILEMKAKASTIAKDDAQAGTATAEGIQKKNGIISDAMNGVMSLPDVRLPQGIYAAAQQLQQSGIFNPQEYQQALQMAHMAAVDPAGAKQALQVHNLALGSFSKELENAQKQLANQKTAGEMDPASPLYAPSSAAVAMGTAPGAAQIQGGEVNLAARKAGAEESARMPGEMALARQRQVLSQGDPQAAAQLLVNGDATLSELKSRGATPEFIANTLNTAHQLSGGKYNAQQADAEFQVAKSPANVAFFGSAKSLTDPGGTLDQLAAAGKDLPGGHFPAFNKIADWEKAATGNGPIAKYASLALGVADDYSKVMGGGQGSDSSRLQALNLVGASQSPDQRTASVEGIRGAVGSQLNSRIGKNPVLQRMYGAGESAPAGGAAGQSGAPQDGSMKVNSHGDKIVFRGGQWQLAQ